MSRVMAIALKDAKQLFRNRFVIVISFLAIFVYAIIYYLMPAQVDEAYTMGLYLEKGRDEVERRLKETGDEGLRITWADSVEQLKELVEARDVQVGFAFTRKGATPVVRLYVSSQTPKEITDQGEVIGREFALSLLGYEVPVDIEERVVGEDVVGNQIALRNKFRVLFLIFVFLVEMYSLANLLVDEVGKKTVIALLVTPVSIAEFMTSKALIGIGLAFSEALLTAFLLQIVTLQTFLPVIVLLLLGAVLFTGVSFLIGALGRDMFTVLLWLVLVLIILAIPALSLTSPDLISPITQAIPTYFFVNALDGLVNRGATFLEVLGDMAYLAGFGAALFGVGFLVFRRKVGLA